MATPEPVKRDPVIYERLFFAPISEQQSDKIVLWGIRPGETEAEVVDLFVPFAMEFEVKRFPDV